MGSVPILVVCIDRALLVWGNSERKRLSLGKECMLPFLPIRFIETHSLDLTRGNRICRWFFGADSVVGTSKYGLP